MKILLGYDRVFLQHGIYLPIYLDITSRPALMITGESGSGKTVGAKFVLASLAQAAPDTKLYLADLKGYDFKFCRGLPNFVEFDGVVNLIEDFYQVFKDRQMEKINSERDFILFIEEFPSLMLNPDKKLISHITYMLGQIALMGRSSRCSLWLSLQRPDASFFGGASIIRSQFPTVISFGNLDAAHMEMVADGLIDKVKNFPAPNGKGQGIVVINRTVVKPLIVPRLSDREFLGMETLIKGMLE